jgi:hypothetical protein
MGFLSTIGDFLNPLALRSQLDQKQLEIERLNRAIQADDGSWVMDGAERKYINDDDQGRFDRKKHRNLIGLSMRYLKAEGLDCERTSANSPLGDLRYSETGSQADKAKLKLALKKMQSKHN